MAAGEGQCGVSSLAPPWHFAQARDLRADAFADARPHGLSLKKKPL
jgi:hypothetical protein